MSTKRTKDGSPEALERHPRNQAISGMGADSAATYTLEKQSTEGEGSYMPQELLTAGLHGDILVSSRSSADDSVTHDAKYGGIITGVGLPVGSVPDSSKAGYSIESVESFHNDFSGHVKVRVVDVSQVILRKAATHNNHV